MRAQPTVGDTTTELLEFLQQPATYPDKTASVELRETHISWVFLAGRRAYKLKKPVRFDFLDFSTCAKRQAACEAELRLNRRLSPSVYRAVVPIRRTSTGQLSIGGDGEVVDWLVKMRRLADQRTLEAVLLGDSEVQDVEDQIQSVATHLAKFYATQAPLTVRTADFRECLRRHVDENERQLLSIAATDEEGDSIQRVHHSQRRFLVTHREQFEDRVRDGRIVDGHGDLRPDHIYLYRHPLVIDCVEFNAEYRRNDIVDELAFLAMECDRLGHPFVGHVLFATYERISHDSPAARLIAFYKAYRACVRAKIAGLRSRQQLSAKADSSVATEHHYLRLADSYIDELGPRLLLVVGGLMGTGKTTLANQLGQLLSAEVVSSDMVRQRRVAAAHGHNGQQERFGQGKYTLQARRATYESLFEAAAQSFAKNDTVILDGTFSAAEMRTRAVQLADRYDATILQVECACSRKESIARIEQRVSAGDSASEARPEFYDRQAAQADPPLTSAPLVVIDTTLALGSQEQLVLACVQDLIHQNELRRTKK